MCVISLLYLEDDQALAQVTKRALEKRHFKVHHFASLAALADFPEQHIRQCTQALLDLRLDDGHALEVVRQLKTLNPDIKIVILTGYASIATSVQAIKLGAHNYLAKPATIDQILMAFEDNPDDALDHVLNDEQTLSLKRLEWEHIQQALTENQGNISATARQLNMHRRTLQRKLLKKPAL